MKTGMTLRSTDIPAQRGTLPHPASLLPLGLLTAAFVVDLNTPFGVADGFLYLLAVLSCFWLPNARAAVYTAAASMLPMTIGLVTSPAGAPFLLEIANRSLGAVTIWVAALVVWHNARLHHERSSLLARVRELGQAGERAKYDAKLELSQWLHEGIAQELAAVAWGLDRLIRRGGTEQEVRALAKELRAVIDDSQRSVRHRAAALRVPVEPAELIAAIEQHVATFRRHTGLVVATSGIANLGDVRLDAADLCLAVVREALTNVAKHAQASLVTIEFLQAEGAIRARISDDGRGISTIDRMKVGSLGLLGLEERLAGIGGSLAVSNVDPHGARVEAEIPFEPRTRQSARIGS
jgi:signal transduction histidine kinase